MDCPSLPICCRVRPLQLSTTFVCDYCCRESDKKTHTRPTENIHCTLYSPGWQALFLNHLPLDGNHSPLLWRGVGGEASGEGLGVRLLFNNLHLIRIQLRILPAVPWQAGLVLRTMSEELLLCPVHFFGYLRQERTRVPSLLALISIDSRSHSSGETGWKRGSR